MRDEERKHKDPKTSQGASQLVKKAMGDEEERYKDPKTSQSVSQLVNNGYVAQTLRQIQIGIKSTHEWIGEDLLIMNEPNLDAFEYTAVAVTKCVTYAISFADLFKIPQSIRD